MEKKFKSLLITRSNFLRIMTLSVVVVFLMNFTNANGQKANFNGVWAFNESKSKLSEGARYATKLTVKQEGNNLTVDRVRNFNGDETTTTEKFTLDGKESVNTGPRGDSKSVATWSADGKTLTFATTRTTSNGERKSSEAWSMPDAKTMSIDSKATTRDGDPANATLVYDKK